MRYVVLISLLLIASITTAFADIDCGNETVSISLSKDISDVWTTDKVKNVCGNPTEIKNWSEEVLNKYGDGFLKTTVKYTLWTYNRGSSTFIQYLLFKDGVLINIKDGEYGSN